MIVPNFPLGRLFVFPLPSAASVTDQARVVAAVLGDKIWKDMVEENHSLREVLRELLSVQVTGRWGVPVYCEAYMDPTSLPRPDGVAVGDFWRVEFPDVGRRMIPLNRVSSLELRFGGPIAIQLFGSSGLWWDTPRSEQGGNIVFSPAGESFGVFRLIGTIGPLPNATYDKLVKLGMQDRRHQKAVFNRLHREDRSLTIEAIEFNPRKIAGALGILRRLGSALKGEDADGGEDGAAQEEEERGGDEVAPQQQGFNGVDGVAQVAAQHQDANGVAQEEEGDRDGEEVAAQQEVIDAVAHEEENAQGGEGRGADPPGFAHRGADLVLLN